MRYKRLLVGASLLSVLLLSLHLAQDALRARLGTVAAGRGNLVAVLILVVLLSGPLLLAERRSGQIIMVLGALFSIGMPVLHFTLGEDMHKYGAPLLFVWSLIALGVIGLISIMLSTHELPRVWRNPTRADPGVAS